VPGSRIRISLEDEKYLKLAHTRRIFFPSYAGAVEPTSRATGRLYVGTSGFAYPDWAPRFYAAGIRGDGLLRAYGERLNTCELNNTFYQHPTPKRIEAWLGATPGDFRFVVKAQRGGGMRALFQDPSGTVPWLTAPYRLFAERLGCVLFRVPDPVKRDDDALRRLLVAWPADLPLTVEFQHASWHVDEVYEQLMQHHAALCATDLDDGEAPDLRVTGEFLYLRMRRSTYADADLAGWRARLAPFLNDGLDAYVFFRHDATGESALRAERFVALLSA
jgi:uncharacterized protein YecE (DUF72 family)